MTIFFCLILDHMSWCDPLTYRRSLHYRKKIFIAMLLTCTFIFQMPHKKRAYTLVFTSIFKSFHQLVLSKSTFIIYVINKIKETTNFPNVWGLPTWEAMVSSRKSVGALIVALSLIDQEIIQRKLTAKAKKRH